MESNLRSLYCFVTAAEELNFTRAAKKLYITQQSLSKHIKKLEEQYEVTLFDRHPTLRLTVAGEHLLAYARRAIREENRLFNDLQSEIAFGHMRLRVGIPTQRCTGYLPDIHQVYSKKQPNVIVSYISYGFAPANAALMTGDIDMYFSTAASAGKNGKLLPIVDDELFFVVSEPFLRQTLTKDWERFLLAHAGGITVEETVEFPVVLPPGNSSLREQLNVCYQRAAHAPKVVMELTDNRVTFEMCARSVGGAFVSKSLLFHRCLDADVRLYAFPVRNLDDQSGLVLVYPDAAVLPDYMRHYIDCAKDVIVRTNETMDRYLAGMIRGNRILPIDYGQLRSYFAVKGADTAAR